MQTPWNPLYWASEHWTQLVALSALFFFLYRVYLVVRKFLLYPEAIISTEKNLNIMMTNHLPHLQVELEQVNSNLAGVRDDFKELRNDFRIVLASRLP
jgi:hypothetical protein